jgi:hypothetical protein
MAVTPEMIMQMITTDMRGHEPHHEIAQVIAVAKPPNENGWASGNPTAAESAFVPLPVSAT